MDRLDNTKENEINYSEFIDQARKISTEDLIQSEYYINLALIEKNIDIQSKIQAWALKTFIHFKSKNLNEIMTYCKKAIRLLEKNDLKDIETNIAFCLIRIFYRSGTILQENKQIYIASQCFYQAKNIFEEKKITNETESLNTLENNFSLLLKEITSELQGIKKIFENKEEMLKNLYEVKEFLTNTYREEMDKSLTPGESKKYFLVSILWVQNFLTFYQKYENMENIDKLFDRNKILLKYFNEEDNLSCYPGPVNNFDLIDFKETLIDHNCNESNTFLKKGIKEKTDFVYVTEEEWNRLKGIFGCNYAIVRNNAIVSNESIIEVNLRKIKILILNEKLPINLIYPKSIQISKQERVIDLKNKIIRCCEKYIQEISSHNHRFYIFNFALKERKKDTLEIIYSYVNKQKNLKIDATEIIDDEILISDFIYGPGDLIIVEIFNSDNNFIQLKSKESVCSLCNNQIHIIVHCPYCSNYIYCSDVCRRKDEDHKNYHKKTNKLYKMKFELKEIFDADISELIDRGSRHGLVGLKNLGNTCFMNSALQCLSNCEELTKYFLLRKVFEEINRNNKHGSGGEVAKAYYELVKELWLGVNNYLCPSDFRQIFVRFVRQFAGFSQHDSQEMLTFMLDTLHEDLNRIKHKPYIEMNEKGDNESDLDASTKWWKNHILRENSIIVDLFHGQYKSVITCPECGKISITYDPFMYLGLPIPNNQNKIKFKFFPYNDGNNYKCYEYELPINEHTSVKEMKIIVNSRHKLDIEILEALCLNKEKQYKKIVKNEEFLYPYFEINNEIVIYQKYKDMENFQNYITFYVFPLELLEEKSFFIMKKNTQRILSYPSLISMNKNDSVRDLNINIYKLYRKVMNDTSNSTTTKNFYENIDNINYIKAEFDKFNTSEESMRLYIFNNIPESTGFFSSKPSCEFCNYKCEYCLFYNSINPNHTISKFSSMKKYRNEMILLVELINYKKNAKLYNEIDFPIQINNRSLISKSDVISIYDCINLFKTEEKLEKENAWYCSKCKKHQEAFKKLDIYRPPNVLIVQFKRFKIKSNNSYVGFMTNKKNDCLINYPIEGLDLRNIIVGELKDEAVYDLFAISQHYGGMSSGHYTALCKNYGSWYEYDDDRIVKASSKDIVTNSAYLLFYRKKNLDKK